MPILFHHLPGASPGCSKPHPPGLGHFQGSKGSCSFSGQSVPVFYHPGKEFERLGAALAAGITPPRAVDGHSVGFTADTRVFWWPLEPPTASWCPKFICSSRMNSSAALWSLSAPRESHQLSHSTGTSGKCFPTHPECTDPQGRDLCKIRAQA